jgi:hypothetical protein
VDDALSQNDHPDVSHAKVMNTAPKECINLNDHTVQPTAAPIKSINISGIDIYQECIDGLCPGSMVNDNIVSYLFE